MKRELSSKSNFPGEIQNAFPTKRKKGGTVKKFTDKSDDKFDKKNKIKENSKKDKALDKKRGVAEDDKKKKKFSAIGTQPTRKTFGLK